MTPRKKYFLANKFLIKNYPAWLPSFNSYSQNNTILIGRKLTRKLTNLNWILEAEEFLTLYWWLIENSKNLNSLKNNLKWWVFNFDLLQTIKLIVLDILKLQKSLEDVIGLSFWIKLFHNHLGFQEKSKIN